MKEGPDGVRVHHNARHSVLTLELQRPVLDKNPGLCPSIEELSSGSLLDPDYDPSAELLDGEEEESAQAGSCSERPLGDHPLLIWSQLRSEFLDEILKLNAFETYDNDACEACQTSTGIFHCLSCVNTQRLCQACIVAGHEGLPLHRIEFELGHKRMSPCLFPAMISDFVIVDVDGIHTVNMAFCNCTQGISLYIQLLRQRLFPATTIHPHTAFTFCILHFFQLLLFMSKVSTYEFYQTLVCLTNNSGMHTPPDRYQAFLRVMREWRHICALKRFGHGHEPSGIQGTKQGELALRCPACPQPSINLPPDWRKNLAAHWLYRLFLAIDANFWLCRLNVSSNESDPGLNAGYAYFIEETAFCSHLAAFGKVIPEEEKGTCNNHDAVKLVNSRGGNGAAATGVGAVVCGWHDMKHPMSVRDLEKERDILYLVPKFHLPAHVLKCHDNFSFNFSAGVGWAATNALAASTKEMGPGAHRDTLDDHFGDHNWRKIIILDAVEARLEHVEEFIGYEDALRVEHSEYVNSWRQMVLLWESDQTQQNPFSPTLRHKEEQNVSAVEIRHDVSPSELIAQGLLLEEAQYVSVLSDENRLGCKIEAWISVQMVYMPRTALLHAHDDDRCKFGVTMQPSKIPLYLPSTTLKLNAIDSLTQSTILDDEWCLRLAQANDVLAVLQEHLLLKSYLTTWQQHFSQGQCYGTKANTLFHRVEDKIVADVTFRQLKDEDVRGLDRYNESTSEGHRNLAWIWKTNLQSGDQGLQEGKWLFAPLRLLLTQRWQEECELLTEELRRVQATFSYYTQLWTKRADSPQFIYPN
ncbi:hypothetical protein IW261DRAFT_1554106 [Armillaria novae-zelandiae]|uniref:CxC2-like cysteine cluster KDZ transposase-associated domain-containing protein n=1 Tax=Armillaria novae-zelandiae TaxID=153914 RepID=A0AA39ND36_9AGAR|nr:hypothetical protein IW261DRAFT_1554106 [Armillaria novae-zelandiae]